MEEARSSETTLRLEMENVPKIVRERLGTAAPAADHPDANLLTAFAEQSLPTGERAGVLEHLARCADCRDVVALALPETEAALPLQRPARGGWLSWPALRWGLVTAGVAVIATFGIMRYQHREQPAMMAKQESPRLDMPVAESKSQPATAAAPASPERSGQDKTETPLLTAPAIGTNSLMVLPKAMARAKTLTTPAPEKSSRGAIGGIVNGLNPRVPLHSGPAVANQWQQNQWQQNSANVQNGPQVRTSNSAAVPSAAPQRAPLIPSVGTPSASPASSAQGQPLEAQGQGASMGAVIGGVLKDSSNAATPVPAAPPVPAVSGATLDRQTAQEEARLEQPGVRGQMGGYVVDATGAAIPNTHITVTGASGTTSTVTDSEGRWLIAGLPSGNYKAQAAASGFKTLARDFNYDSNQSSLYVFPLSIGNVSETVEVSAANPTVQTESAEVGAVTGKEVTQLPLNGRNVTQLVAISPGVVPVGVVPRWSINSSGGLQRSIDQGKTWMDVSVAPAPAGSYDLVTVANSQAISVTKSDKKALKREFAKAKTSPVVFRAVAANGADVWAGGMAGMLYHSLDAGNTWTRVAPSASGSLLTGDVLTVDFPDPQHGKLTTSTPEVWTTSDAGQTWQKQ